MIRELQALALLILGLGAAWAVGLLAWAAFAVLVRALG